MLIALNAIYALADYPTVALKSVSENGVTFTYTYDECGNVLTESDGTSVKSYTYNEFDGRASYTLKVNNVAIASETYAYDAARQLASVTTDSVQVTYGYDMNGNRTNDVTFNKTTGVALYGHNYAFDGANRVVNVQGMVSVNNGASLLIPVSETYTYNLDGSMATKSESGVTTSYVYDGAGRLTTEMSGGNVTAYTYDYANNRTMMSKGGVLTTYTYDANNRMLTETEGGTVKSYTYDANGNQLTGDGATYTYNARGQQASYTKGTTTASYTYLPTGLRKSKTVGVTTTSYVWDGQKMVYEYNGTNTTGGTAYYYGLTLISQGNYAYYLYNGHGDVVQLVTSTGTLGRSYDYDAFGNEVNPSASDTNSFRYAGQYFDSETGTYYLRARYYDPGIGRFTQQDGWAFRSLSDPLSLNLYTYCYSNPVRFVDISGNIPIETVGDIVSIGSSAVELILNPNLANVGYLLWDIGAAVLPYVPGSYVAKAGKLVVKADKYADSLKAFFKVADLAEAANDFVKNHKTVLASYTQLKKMVNTLGVKGFEVHHLIEKRFVNKLGLGDIDVNDILSIALDKDTHRQITNRFRELIGYRNDVNAVTNWGSANADDIWRAIVTVYKENGMENVLPFLKENLIELAKQNNKVLQITNWGGYKN